MKTWLTMFYLFFLCIPSAFPADLPIYLNHVSLKEQQIIFPVSKSFLNEGNLVIQKTDYNREKKINYQARMIYDLPAPGKTAISPPIAPVLTREIDSPITVDLYKNFNDRFPRPIQTLKINDGMKTEPLSLITLSYENRARLAEDKPQFASWISTKQFTGGEGFIVFIPIKIDYSKKQFHDGSLCQWRRFLNYDIFSLRKRPDGKALPVHTLGPSLGSFRTLESFDTDCKPETFFSLNLLQDKVPAIQLENNKPFALMNVEHEPISIQRNIHDQIIELQANVSENSDNGLNLEWKFLVGGMFETEEKPVALLRQKDPSKSTLTLIQWKDESNLYQFGMPEISSEMARFPGFTMMRYGIKVYNWLSSALSITGCQKVRTESFVLNLYTPQAEWDYFNDSSAQRLVNKKIRAENVGEFLAELKIFYEEPFFCN